MLLAQRFEPGGEVDRSAVDGVALAPATAHVASDQRACVDADADAQALAGERAFFDAGKNRARGLERVGRVLGILERNVEDREHRIPVELRDDAVVIADDPRHLVEIGVQHLDHAHCADAFGHRRKAGDVRVQHRRFALDRCEHAATRNHRVDDGARDETPEQARQRCVVPLRLELTLQRVARPPHDDGNQEGDDDQRYRLLNAATEPAEVGIEQDRQHLVGSRIRRDVAPVQVTAAVRRGERKARSQPSEPAMPVHTTTPGEKLSAHMPRMTK